MSPDHTSGEFVRRDLPTGIYVILDHTIAGRSHLELVREALRGGARLIQLREKKMTFEEMADLGRQILELTRPADALLIVNDNPYLAAEIDADGVHVGQEDIPADIAREIVGPDKLVGLSTHNRRQAREAESMPVDYIGIGPIYRTASKKSEWPVMGPDFVRWVSKNIRLPFVAIGGITLERTAELRDHGADRVAVIGDIMRAADVAARTRAIQETLLAPTPEP